MKRKWIVPVVAAACLCAGCALLPQEEQLPDAPILRAFTGEQHTLVAVERGDIVKEEIITCSYDAAKQELLSFPVGGERIAELYIRPGSQVKAGQLLAELDNTQIKKEIQQQKLIVEDLQRRTEQAKEKLDLNYERVSRLGDAAAADPGRFSGQKSSANRTCLELADEYDYLEKLLKVEKTALEDLEFQLTQRQIYASFDGTVLTVTQSGNSDSAFFAGQTVAVMADLSTGSFQSTFPKGLLFEGDVVTIVCDDGEREVKVEQITEQSGGKKSATFQLLAPDPTLKAGMKGKITVVTERHDDVLYLPVTTVKNTNTHGNNVHYVYCVDENGLRYTKVVEIGLAAGGIVEIVSGLEEGEMVLR